MVKSLICRIFWHNFTEQHYEMENHDSCKLMVTCSRCSHKQSQGIFNHKYKD